MGTFKKHNQGWAIEQTNLYPSTPSTSGQGTTVGTVPFKSTGGVSSTGIKFYTSDFNEAFKNFSMAALTPVATGDLLEDYDVADYTCAAIGTTTYSTTRTVQSDRVLLTYSVTVANNTGADITVGAIRFKKQVRLSNANFADVMLYSYYLDEPKTIANGDAYTFSVPLQIIAQDITTE